MPFKRKEVPCAECERECQCEWTFANLVWNGRRQFTGIVMDRANVKYKLVDPDDEHGPRVPITNEEEDAILKDVILSNLNRTASIDDETNKFVDLTKIHWVCNDVGGAGTFQLHPSERGPPRTERDMYGTLDVDIVVGDMVKVAANISALVELRLDPKTPPPEEMDDAELEVLVEALRRNNSSERYWAHVLSIERDPDDVDLDMLTLLTPNELAHVPAGLAREPFIVRRRCVFAHKPSFDGN